MEDHLIKTEVKDENNNDKKNENTIEKNKNENNIKKNDNNDKNFESKEVEITYTYDEALDKIGFGYYQVTLIFLCGAGWFFDGVEYYFFLKNFRLLLISFIIPEMTQEFKLNPVQTGLFLFLINFRIMW